MQVTIRFPDVSGFISSYPINSLDELVRFFGTASTYTIEVRHPLNPDVPIIGKIEVVAESPQA